MTEAASYPVTPENDSVYRPRVLLPELHDPVIASIKEHHSGDEFGVDLSIEEMSLDGAAELLKNGEYDIVIAGIGHDTPTVLQTVLEHFRKPDTLVSSFFMMERPGQEPQFFADCAVLPTPSPSQVVRVAEHTCEAVKKLGYEPVVAFLDLSTFGSAEKLPGVVQVREATKRFQERNPDIVSYGEVQMDAALNERIRQKKAEGRGVKIDTKIPNVFIFPDGRSGNITYKALEQLAGYTAIGPMLTGTSHHFHDSSRGASEHAILREIELARDIFLAEQHPRSETPAT
jgi:phosphotransacetylase